MTTEGDQLRATIVRILGVKPDLVVDDALLTEGLGADALDNVELVIAVEDEFNIAIADIEIDAIVTVGDLRELIASKLAMKAAAA